MVRTRIWRVLATSAIAFSPLLAQAMRAWRLRTWVA